MHIACLASLVNQMSQNDYQNAFDLILHQLSIETIRQATAFAAKKNRVDWKREGLDRFDVVSTIYTKLIESKPIDNLFSWAVTCAKNLFLDHRKIADRYIGATDIADRIDRVHAERDGRGADATLAALIDASREGTPMSDGASACHRAEILATARNGTSEDVLPGTRRDIAERYPWRDGRELACISILAGNMPALGYLYGDSVEAVIAAETHNLGKYKLSRAKRAPATSIYVSEEI